MAWTLARAQSWILSSKVYLNSGNESLRLELLSVTCITQITTIQCLEKMYRTLKRYLTDLRDFAQRPSIGRHSHNSFAKSSESLRIVSRRIQSEIVRTGCAPTPRKSRKTLRCRIDGTVLLVARRLMVEAKRCRRRSPSLCAHPSQLTLHRVCLSWPSSRSLHH